MPKHINAIKYKSASYFLLDKTTRCLYTYKSKLIINFARRRYAFLRAYLWNRADRRAVIKMKIADILNGGG